MRQTANAFFCLSIRGAKKKTSLFIWKKKKSANKGDGSKQ